MQRLVWGRAAAAGRRLWGSRGEGRCVNSAAASAAAERLGGAVAAIVDRRGAATSVLHVSVLLLLLLLSKSGRLRSTLRRRRGHCDNGRVAAAPTLIVPPQVVIALERRRRQRLRWRQGSPGGRRALEAAPAPVARLRLLLMRRRWLWQRLCAPVGGGDGCVRMGRVVLSIPIPIAEVVGCALRHLLLPLYPGRSSSSCVPLVEPRVGGPPVVCCCHCASRAPRTRPLAILEAAQVAAHGGRL